MQTRELETNSRCSCASSSLRRSGDAEMAIRLWRRKIDARWCCGWITAASRATPSLDSPTFSHRSTRTSFVSGGLYTIIAALTWRCLLTSFPDSSLSNNAVGPRGLLLLGEALVTNNSLQFLELESCELVGSPYRPQLDGLLALSKGVQSARSSLRFLKCVA